LRNRNDSYFSNLTRPDQGEILAALASAPPSWTENLTAAILAQLPDSPTHKQVVDATVMALVQVGIFIPPMGLDILTGPDVLPLIAGGGAMQAAATAV
jgi:hypothetical protein